jgi:hypothetical protein
MKIIGFRALYPEGVKHHVILKLKMASRLQLTTGRSNSNTVAYYPDISGATFWVLQPASKLENPSFQNWDLGAPKKFVGGLYFRLDASHSSLLLYPCYQRQP